MIPMWLTAILAGITWVVARSIALVFGFGRGIHALGQSAPNAPIVTVVVLGSGGHTAEMMALTKRLSCESYSFAYVLAASDSTSVGKVETLLGRKLPTDSVYRIPRSREVGQSFTSTFFTTAWSCIWSFLLVARLRPQLIIANGPGTCLPVALSAFLCRAAGVLDSRLIFCESFCRVKSLSLTGKLLYPIADRFVVQWPQLREKYARAEYIGVLC